jgi:HSP20 family protein
MTLTRWSPSADFALAEIDALGRMFESAFGSETSGVWAPAADVYETASKDLVVKLDLPDVRREDVKVTFEQQTLAIEGERKIDAAVGSDRYLRVERGHGKFRRTFALPPTVDVARVQASYQDGVLTVTLPQRDEARAREIQIG